MNSTITPAVGQIRRDGWFFHVGYVGLATVLLTKSRRTRADETSPPGWPDGWTSETDREFPVNRPRAAVARMPIVAPAPPTTPRPGGPLR